MWSGGWSVLIGELDPDTPSAQPKASSIIFWGCFPSEPCFHQQTGSYLQRRPVHPCCQHKMFAVHLPPAQFSSNCLNGPLFSSLIEWFLSLPSSFFFRWSVSETSALKKEKEMNWSILSRSASIIIFSRVSDGSEPQQAGGPGRWPTESRGQSQAAGSSAGIMMTSQTMAFYFA